MSSVMSDAIRTTISDYLARFSANDRDGWLALFTDDATVEDPVGSLVRHGKEQIGAFFDESHAMPTSLELVADGPAIVVGSEAAFRFTIRVNLDGAIFLLSAIDAMTFDDAGRISSQRAYVDHASMAPES